MVASSRAEEDTNKSVRDDEQARSRRKRAVAGFALSAVFAAALVLAAVHAPGLVGHNRREARAWGRSIGAAYDDLLLRLPSVHARAAHVAGTTVALAVALTNFEAVPAQAAAISAAILARAAVTASAGVVALFPWLAHAPLPAVEACAACAAGLFCARVAQRLSLWSMLAPFAIVAAVSVLSAYVIGEGAGTTRPAAHSFAAELLAEGAMWNNVLAGRLDLRMPR